MLTQNELKKLLKYDKDTGIFTRISAHPKQPYLIGKKAGCEKVNKDGKRYIHIIIKNQSYYAHRLAFLYVKGEFPKNEVDHINGSGIDNSWKNLRDVTPLRNAKNRRLSINNKYGLSGLRLRGGKWEVSIRPDKTYIHLGVFDNLLDAAAARKSAELKYNYHNNHGSQREL